MIIIMMMMMMMPTTANNNRLRMMPSSSLLKTSMAHNNNNENNDKYDINMKSTNNSLLLLLLRSFIRHFYFSSLARASPSSSSSSSSSSLFILLIIHFHFFNQFTPNNNTINIVNASMIQHHFNSSRFIHTNSRIENEDATTFTATTTTNNTLGLNGLNPIRQRKISSLSSSSSAAAASSPSSYLLPTIDGHHHKVLASPQPSSNNFLSSSSSSSLPFGSCTSPEVMVNGSPSPDIAGTVTGGQLGSIEEIQFVGVVSTSQNNNTTNQSPQQQTNGKIKQKRVCKIKCLNGVWIGPLCAFQSVDQYEPVLRPCRVPTIANGSVLVIDARSKTNPHQQLVSDKSRDLPHGSIVKVNCKEIGLYKLSVEDATMQCVDGLWNSANIPHCEPTTLHMNFSLSSPPSILYTLLDGTLGINEIEQQLVILPGAILHLDCVFQETFGQPQWSVSDIPGLEAKDSMIDQHSDSSATSSSTVTDQNSNHQAHHQVFDYTEQQQTQHHPSVSSAGNNNHLNYRRRGYHPRKYYQQQITNQDVRTHTTGWAILTDKQPWKYRLAIYYASESDTGRYQCTTPNGFSNYVDVVVQDVQCPSLEELSAQQPNDPNRSASKTGYRMHDRIRFSCSKGYRLRGRREVKCLPNGQWSHPFPTCQEINCPDYSPNDLDGNLFVTREKYSSKHNNDVDGENGEHHHNGEASSTTPRQILRFRCSLGYRLIGATSIICNEQNQWSEPFPTCQQLNCPEPDVPSNVQVIKSTNGRYLVGDYVQFGCRKGFRMIGQEIATCLHTEQWSSPPPICKKFCYYPAKLLHGYYQPVKFQYEIGEMVSIRCEIGYRLAKEFGDDGQPPTKTTLLCSTDGLWIGQAVKCKRLSTNKRHGSNNNNNNNKW